jgi:hypothetical protein
MCIGRLTVSTLTLDDLDEAWQRVRREPGELVGIWNHELGQEDIGMVVLEENKIQKVKPKYDLSKVHVMIGGRIEKVSKWDVFPVGRARATIPF